MQELQVYKTTICIGEAVAMELWLRLDKPFVIADKALVAHCPHKFLSRTALLPANINGKLAVTANRLVEWLSSKGFRQGNELVALGGRNICEIASTTATAYGQPLKWHTIPSTIISMLTAIDFVHAKRKTQPNTVAVDSDFLKSLPREDYTAGLAEIAKLALLEGDVLYDTLLRYPELICEGEPGIMADVLAMSCGTKADIISIGALGRPSVLNIGHTAAAAIARDSGEAIPYGQALALGILMEAKAGERLGLIDADTVEEISSLWQTYGFKTTYSFQSELGELIAATDTLIIPFIKELGNTLLEEVDRASFVEALQASLL